VNNIKIKTRSIHTTERDNKFVIESKIIQQSFDEIISFRKLFRGGTTRKAISTILFAASRRQILPD